MFTLPDIWMMTNVRNTAFHTRKVLKKQHYKRQLITSSSTFEIKKPLVKLFFDWAIFVWMPSWWYSALRICQIWAYLGSVSQEAWDALEIHPWPFKVVRLVTLTHPACMPLTHSYPKSFLFIRLWVPSLVSNRRAFSSFFTSNFWLSSREKYLQQRLRI